MASQKLSYLSLLLCEWKPLVVPLECMVIGVYVTGVDPFEGEEEDAGAWNDGFAKVEKGEEELELVLSLKIINNQSRS